MKKTSEKEKKRMREWYKKNREHKIAYSKKYQKDNNYSCEKTKEQRSIRYIKRKTRYNYPITNQKCEFCGAKATEHHHNTTPIQFDKFNYVCHYCHMEEDLKMENHSKTNKMGTFLSKLFRSFFH